MHFLTPDPERRTNTPIQHNKHTNKTQVHILGDFDHRYPNFATPVSEFYGTWKWLMEQRGVYP